MRQIGVFINQTSLKSKQNFSLPNELRNLELPLFLFASGHPVAKCKTTFTGDQVSIEALTMPSPSTVPLPTVSVPCPFDASVSDRVRYGCSCGCARPVSRLYFCRHCLEPRCPHCVSHEVDSHYCPNCLENMPSAEARLKRNRCAYSRGTFLFL